MMPFIFASQIFVFVLIVYTWRKKKVETETFEKLTEIVTKLSA
jgi:hypothetical protein